MGKENEGTMDSYKVSVIMPSLNVREYIEECLSSVCRQTLHNIEILCIDAGSTDGTVQAIREYAAMDSRIKLIHSDKKSYGFQVNIGIQQAKGKYIAILETDDYIDEQMYETLFDLAEKTECDYVKGNYRRYYTTSGGKRVFEASDTLRCDHSNYEKVLYLSEHKELIQYDTNVWTGIYRRDFLVNHNIKCNESAGAAFQDIGFLQQVFWLAETAYYTQKPFYNYCIDREMSSTNHGNGMRFAFQEYRHLLSDDRISNIKLDRINIVYERMSDVFEENLKKILLQDKEDENADIISWFIEILTQKQQEGIIRRDYLEQAVCHRSDWVKQRKQALQDKQIYREQTLNFLKDADVIIFGSGIRGKNAFRELVLAHIPVCAFCDNNTDLWGEVIGDIKIYSLEDGLKFFPGAKFVIANKFSYHDIEKQLLHEGVSADHIIVW